jgi:hypothetical protein
MKVTIDRFEGDFAVVEKPDRTMMNIMKCKLPAGAKEGDILSIDGDTIKIEAAETSKRKKRVHDLMNELWEDKKS